MVRKLGRSGIEVSAMGLGCWAIGGPAWSGKSPLGWGKVDDEETVSAIRRALELGVTFFDTADVYGTGHSEKVLGRALAGKRDQVVIATKFGFTYNEDTRQLGEPETRPEYIREACEHSLRRLNTDFIDLYQFHGINFPVDQVPEVVDTLEGLVQAGKIRAYGLSTDSLARAGAFARGSQCTAIQLQLNALEHNPAMVMLCEKLNLAGINREPLAMGLLTGKYSADTSLGEDDIRGIKGPGWIKYFKHGRPDPEWLKKVESIRAILTSNGRTMVQGALAWLWSLSPLMIPIPGFRTVKHVEENAGAMQFGPLSKSQLDEINQIMGRNSLLAKTQNLLRSIRIQRNISGWNYDEGNG